MQERPMRARQQLPVAAHQFTGSLSKTLLKFSAVGFGGCRCGIWYHTLTEQPGDLVDQKTAHGEFDVQLGQAVPHQLTAYLASLLDIARDGLKYGVIAHQALDATALIVELPSDLVPATVLFTHETVLRDTHLVKKD